MSAETEEPKPSTDLAALSKLIRVPPGVVSARWSVRPLRPPGSRLVPGPMDTVLIAYLQVPSDAWPSLGPVLRASNTVTRPIPVRYAKALLPPALVASLPISGEKVLLTGTELDATSLENSPYRGITAMRIGNDIYAAFRTQ